MSLNPIKQPKYNIGQEVKWIWAPPPNRDRIWVIIADDKTPSEEENLIAPTGQFVIRTTKAPVEIYAVEPVDFRGTHEHIPD